MSSSPNPFQNRPGRSSRQVGDAPSLGQVPKMNKGSESRVTPHARRRASNIEPSKTFVVTLIGSLVAVLLLVAGGVLWFVNSQRTPAEEEKEALALPSAPLSTKPAETPVATSLDEESAVKLVRTLLAARNDTDLDGLIRPTEQEPAAILAKLAGLEGKDGKVKDVRYLGSLDSRALQLEGVLVDFANGRNRLALISPDPSGTWQVDFDAFDRYSTPAWDELLSGKEQSGTVRIFISPDSYYNDEYADDSKWVCYGLASPDNETLMFGYVPKDGELHQLLGKVLSADPVTGKANRKATRMTLEIRHDPSAEKRQFEITRVLSDEWAVGDQALDQKLSRPLSETAE